MLKINLIAAALILLLHSGFVFAALNLGLRLGGPRPAAPRPPPRLASRTGISYSVTRLPTRSPRPTSRRPTDTSSLCDDPSCFSGTTTPIATASAYDTAYSNCGIAWATIEFYSSVYYNYWDYFSDYDLAALFCYEPSDTNPYSAVWAPNAFDVPWGYCPQWAQTANPSWYSFYITAAGFCTQVQNILNAYSTDTSVPTLAIATPSPTRTSFPSSPTQGHSERTVAGIPRISILVFLASVTVITITFVFA